MAEDSMIEIEALGNVEDRVMLNEINSILQSNIQGLQINKQSKYERGIQKTKEEADKIKWAKKRESATKKKVYQNQKNLNCNIM